MPEGRFWRLTSRHLAALTRQWRNHIDRENVALAALRADLYNTSAKEYKRTFEAADFLPGTVDSSIETRAKRLIAQGVPPAAACAIASSKQSKEHNLYVLDSVGRSAAAAKKKRRA